MRKTTFALPAVLLVLSLSPRGFAQAPASAVAPATPAPSELVPGAEPAAPQQPTPAPSAEPSAPSANETPAVVSMEAPAPEKKQPFKGFLIQSEDGDYQLRLGGYVQADARFFTASEGDPINTFAVRRARIEFRGTLAKYFELRIQPELAESKLTLLDAFGNVHFVDEVQLQVGKMKSPVGLEYLQSPSDLLFPEFGLPSLLVPQRDIGFYVHGELMKAAVAYQLGIFNGVPDGTNGDLDENDKKDFEGRLFFLPFKPLGVPALQGFGVGVAGTFGEQDGALPTFRTPGREAFFGYADTASAHGERLRSSSQGYYYFGPVGVLAEYVRTKQAVSDGASTANIVSQAWQVAGSFVLGGQPGYKGTQVDAPLDPFAGTWGALELAARYGALSVERQAFALGFADRAESARVARSFGLAASWWFLKGTRAVLSFDRTAFGGGAPGGDRKTEGVLVTRLQVAL